MDSWEGPPVGAVPLAALQSNHAWMPYDLEYKASVKFAGEDQ